MYYPYGRLAGWACPVPIPGRAALMIGSAGGKPFHAAGALPVYGAVNPFQYGPAAVDPGELFFRAGHPIGGPAEAYRGVSASRFPSPAAVLGSGAPLSPEALGLAGVRIAGNGPWGGGRPI